VLSSLTQARTCVKDDDNKQKFVFEAYEATFKQLTFVRCELISRFVPLAECVSGQ